MKIAVVGSTGLVGQMMLKVLEERGFPVTELLPVASERSIGRNIMFDGRSFPVISMQEAIDRKPDIALFSAGASVSKEWAQAFAAVGCTVIDNSSAWRMTDGLPLVVPEVNGHVLTSKDKIIANPNCSTIQMVVALNPIHRRYGIKRIIVSTYQAVSGTGMKAVKQYKDEASGLSPEAQVYPHTIFANCLPHCDIFLDNDYTKEEMKLVHETRKILEEPGMPVTATAVRVPVVAGHSESVNIELASDADIAEIRLLLSLAPGVKLYDNPGTNQYPMPLLAEGKDDVWVGRIRKDESRDRCWNLFIVADNLRKGAATNAVQIAEYLLEKKILNPEMSGTLQYDNIRNM
ncbi:MAG TPA: aspartate-semialdehyde dehydrogenase [Saprospiraceae bacterium]|nr:aspartate-semialdehyde dehydrogenase [Saprospiraceae bacterium]